MKQLLYILGITVGCLALGSCTDTTEEETPLSTVVFRGVKATEQYDFRVHMNRLYVGERKQEHEKEELHLRSMSDLYSIDGTSLDFHETHLAPQWYKFIILSAPKIIPGTDFLRENFKIFSEKTPGQGSCDLNDYMVDYLPILSKAPGSESPHADLPDGDLFRAVLNRWPQEHLMIQENIQLHRLNGLLEINMGILADQFENRVTEIQLELTVPTRFYVTDNNRDEIKTTDKKTLTWSTHPDDLRQVPENERIPHILRINLLPGTITGQITVKTDAQETFTIPVKGMNGNIVIQKNTQTRLSFNGLYHHYFKVEYAGYDDTKIDVNDQWNGGW